MPYQILTHLIEMDNLLMKWRCKLHMDSSYNLCSLHTQSQTHTDQHACTDTCTQAKGT